MQKMFGSIGKALYSDKKAAAFIAKGGKRADALAQQAYDTVSASSGRRVATAYSDVMGEAARLRQIQVGRNVALGGGATSVGVSSLGSNKKSYYNPMPAPRGTGRYA